MFSQKEGQIPAFYCNLASHYKCKHEGQVLVSRLSRVFKLYTKYRSCLANNQVSNILVCTLCPSLSL